MVPNNTQKLIPIDEIVPGAYIRFITIGDVQYLSVRDFIMYVCDKDNNMAGEIWRRLSIEHKAELDVLNFKFPGRGQCEQPVITFPGAVQLAMFLPGESAKRNRSLMTKIIIRYFAGDPTLIGEIEANAASNNPVAQMARNAVMDNSEEARMKRKREDEHMHLENTLAIKREMYKIEEGVVVSEEKKYVNTQRHMLDVLKIEDMKRVSERNHTLELQRAERDHVIEMAKARAQAAHILKHGVPLEVPVANATLPSPPTPTPPTPTPPLAPNHQEPSQKNTTVAKKRGFTIEHIGETVRKRVFVRADEAGIKTYRWKQMMHFHDADSEAVGRIIEEEMSRTEISLITLMQQLRLEPNQQMLFLKHLRPKLDSQGIQLLSDDTMLLSFCESQKEKLEELMLSAYEAAMREELETAVDELMMERNFNMASITAFALDIKKKFPTIVNMAASNREMAKNIVMQEFYLHNKYFNELCTNRNAKETIFEILDHAHFGHMKFRHDKKEEVYENVMKHIRAYYPEIQLITKHNNLYFKIKETKMVQEALDECLAIGIIQRN